MRAKKKEGPLLKKIRRGPIIAGFGGGKRGTSLDCGEGSP